MISIIKKISLLDKEGLEINDDDVIFNGEYWRIYYNKKTEKFDMLSCTSGYVHGVTNEVLSKFKRIGTYKDNEHLFNCD